MPRKPKAKAVKPRRRVRRSRKNPLIEVNRQKASLHNPIVPKYRTTLESGFIGTMAATPATGYFDLPIGNVSLGYSITPTPFGGTVFGALALNALNPVGYSLLSNLYTAQLALSTKHEILMNPIIEGDVFQLCVFPVSALSTAPAVTDIQLAMSMPYAKTKTCIAYQNKQNMISISVKPWVLLGLTKKQYYDQETFYATVPSQAGPDRVGYVRVLWQLFSGAAASSGITVEVKTQYKSEFFNPDQNLLDT